MKSLREYAFAAQTVTSELRQFGAQEAEVSLSEEIKRLQSSVSERDEKLVGKYTLRICALSNFIICSIENNIFNY